MQLSRDINGPGQGFWREAFAWRGSITPHVLPQVFGFGFIAAGICAFALLEEQQFGAKIGLAVAPFEYVGAALGLLLILRTNAGYDRWWEARKLWGGIVNQSRNLGINALAYGPADSAWRETFVRWVAAFPHVARCSLRGESLPPEVIALVGAEEAQQIESSAHMPSYVALRLADLLREACNYSHADSADRMDRFAFLQLDRERATLIDHIGACERILKTPLPRVYAIKIRRFIALFLITLPFALLHRINVDWLVPVLTMMVAYPLVSLDQIGIELQNPFSKDNVSHLPLDDITANIEKNVTGLLRDSQAIPEELRSRQVYLAKRDV
ncbi:MAG: bestrophin family ion channel [Armatimonadota bacterium]